MLTSHVDQEAMGRLHVPDMVQQRRVDGLILVGPALSSRYVLALRRAGLPIVLIDNLLGETPIDCILWDNENGAYQGTRHLIVGHGHRHIAFLSGPAEWFSSRERAVGYRRALQEAGLDPHIVHMPSTTFATGRQAMRTALEERPALTAVMAVNDAMAAGAIHACQEAGRAVPADVAVVGFDDAPWAEMVTPPLTTLHVPEREVGVQAARRMVDLIERGGQVPVQMRLSVELVVRQSCGCHPA
jgi:LacI family transcriptional regulator